MKFNAFTRKASLLAGKIKGCLPRSSKTITIWGEMVSSPYGGGNQFLKALAGELGRRGYRVLNNSGEEADGHILNSAFFDVEKIKAVVRASRKNVSVVHRIDGPISLYRGKDRELDEEIFALNREIATVTAFQCFYSWQRSLEMGFEPVNPMIIRNASDPDLFFNPSAQSALAGRKTRLISTSWSTNPKKGFETYRYLDGVLDFSKYEYTFVGRSPVEFKNIKIVDALPSDKLGEKLREADIYIAASLNDPASNALLEALTCGLPAIYADSGGHSEFVWYAGLKFGAAVEIPALLRKIERDIESYRLCTFARSIAVIADQYLLAMGFQ